MTGMSGSGKTSISNTLEDENYFVIDNLPPKLVRPLISILTSSKRLIKNILIVFDIRGGEFLKDFIMEYNEVKKSNNTRLLFIDASDETLIKRFQETRRGHPLLEKTLALSIKKERKLLKELKNNADQVINTDNLSAKDLNNIVRKDIILANKDNKKTKFNISIISFGFKYGVPLEVDYIFDTRFIKNPFYEEKLKNLTGKNKEVRDFVFKDKKTKQFFEHILKMILLVKDNYIKEGKNSLTIGFGCTGGRHRSVSFATHLCSALKKQGMSCKIINRDI